MEEVIEVVNYVDGQCIRHLHLMSNIEFDAACMNRYSAVNGVVTREAGIWHLRAMHPFRGAMDFHCEGWVKQRRLVAWSTNGYATIKIALKDAKQEYCKLFGGKPQFAFIKKMPKDVEICHEVGGMTLIEAEWMLERCVAVGCKG